MKQTITLLLILSTALKSAGQASLLTNKQYLIHSQRAAKYYNQQKYLQSGLSFDSLFKANQGKGLNRDKYNAASSWSLANNPDKALPYLIQYSKDIKTLNPDFLVEDQDFKNLHQDPRWKTLMNQCKTSIQNARNKYKVQDTLLSVGTHQLFFSLIKGSSTVILFETGGMDNSKVWGEILIPIFDATGATLITYDRAGFGRSTRDSLKSDLTNEVKSLETGLSKLDYGNTNTILVCHSIGGFYATIFAARNSKKVKSAIFLDASLSCFYTDERVKKLIKLNSNNKDLETIKKENISLYYIFKDLEKNSATMRTVSFPTKIPITDIYAENPPWDEADNKEWKNCHQNFIMPRSNSNQILAKGSNHYIFTDNPQLVISEIAKSYQTAIKN
ncbi:alpha/beta fold hydrolase [Pedobacter sp. PAMC26386]|nr:alpha/beta fold hydrolase [Pedobacter sp. PAMC26386]